VSFCKGCSAMIEWHKTSDGKNIPLDPDPHAQGNLTFDERLRVVYMRPGSKPKMYRSHFATCPKAVEFRRPAEPACEHDGCERTDRHLHCRRCGATDHFASECPEAG
jgi:Zinc knuckle